jgi:single-strand DNA-binding protein
MLNAEIIGNLGGDAELRYSANGQPLLNFNVAANFRVKSQEGEWEDRTEWVRVTMFGARAEALGSYLRRGTKVYVNGRLQARPWTTRDGEIRAGLEIAAGDVELCSSRQQDEGQRQPAAAGRAPSEPLDMNDDDLPF